MADGALAVFGGKLTYTLSRDEIMDIAEKAFQFCMEATGIRLYAYQQEFGLRIVQSLLLEDGEEVTALFARQSGKTETVAVVVDGLMVLLPTLANMKDEHGNYTPMAMDSRISKYRDGLWCGIFAPIHEQAGIMHSRMALRMSSKKMRETAADPEIDIDIPGGRKCLQLPNGSYCDCHSAAPQSNIEGRTYHLILVEECQDVSNYKLRKSIHPMAAATGGSIVKIGTPSPQRNDFYDACERGRRKAAIRGPNDLQTHFEFDYEYPARANPRYKKYIGKEIERLGFDSDEFRMAYRLHWLLERGMFVEPELFDRCGISRRDKLKIRRRGVTHTFVRPDYPTTTDRTTPMQVAAIDIGRTNDSTVITIAKVFWDAPVKVGSEDRFPVHLVNWLEIQGDDHEEQYPQIIGFLANYNLGLLTIDATGRGDPIYSRVKADLEPGGRVEVRMRDGSKRFFDFPVAGIRVVPFVFSLQSKSNGYMLLRTEIRDQRMTYPAGTGARRQAKFRRFVQQMYDLEKSWRGQWMQVQAPEEKGRKGDAHDDYPDSLMMLVWLVNRLSFTNVEVADSALIQRTGERLNASGRWARSRGLGRR